MKIEGRVRELGAVAYQDLKDIVLAFDDEIWLENQSRQKNYKNFHSETQSVIMFFCTGWPNVKIEKQSGWQHMGQQALKMMHEIIKDHYMANGAILRAMVVKMPPGSVIQRHVDKHPSFHIAHRIHVPLKTHRDVEFEVDSEIFCMKEGQGYELNNLLVHQVQNKSLDDRIHFIFDYAPPQQTLRSQ